jgi:NifU-like protein involved in Fe-S cluster formation
VTAAAPAKLYSPELLALATGLAAYPFDPALPLSAEARSRTCGSSITLGLELDDNDCIDRIGMQVSACAIGQASAMLLASHATGSAAADIAAASDALEVWLTGEGELPDWPGLAAIAPARAHPGRHGALLLPWKAACLALSSAASGG